MPGLFISYRRKDVPKVAHRLAEALRAEFGDDNVLIDLHSIAAGSQWTSELLLIGQRADFILAVVGPNWMEPGESGKPRLLEKHDFVRLEIEGVHHFGSTLIPILVNGARLPSGRGLPANLQVLGESQAIQLDETAFDSGVANLIRQLRAYEAAAPPANFTGVWADARLSKQELRIVQVGQNLTADLSQNGSPLGQGRGRLQGREAVLEFGSGTLQLMLSLDGFRAHGHFLTNGQRRPYQVLRTDIKRRRITPEMAEMADRALGVLAWSGLAGLAWTSSQVVKRLKS